MAVEVSLTVLTKSRTVSMVWLTVRLPSAAMVSTVFTSLRTPSTSWRLVEVMVCFCWVVPLERVSVTVSVVFVTPSLTAVVVSEMDLTISADACFVLLAAFWARLRRQKRQTPRQRYRKSCLPVSLSLRYTAIVQLLAALAVCIRGGVGLGGRFAGLVVVVAVEAVYPSLPRKLFSL